MRTYILKIDLVSRSDILVKLIEPILDRLEPMIKLPLTLSDWEKIKGNIFMGYLYEFHNNIFTACTINSTLYKSKRI